MKTIALSDSLIRLLVSVYRLVPQESHSEDPQYCTVVGSCRWDWVNALINVRCSVQDKGCDSHPVYAYLRLYIFFLHSLLFILCMATIERLLISRRILDVMTIILVVRET